MVQQEIDASGIQAIEIVVSGDIAISGGETEAIHLRTDGDSDEHSQFERSDGLLRLRIDGDGRLRLPRRLHVRLVEAAGDVAISGIDGGLEVQEWAGDLRAQEIGGDLRLTAASGDVSLQSIAGTVTCDEVAGDLRARAIEGDVMLKSAAGDVRADAISGNVNVIDEVSGDVLLNDIGGNVTLNSVAGDLRASGCQAVEAGAVSGDLRLAGVREHVTVERVEGDAELDRCDGIVTLKSVNGDLRAQRLEAGLTAPDVHGDVKLRSPFSPGCEYSVVCHGDAQVTLAKDASPASVEFVVVARGGVTVNLPLQEVVREPTEVRGRIGAGEAQVQIESNGRVRLGEAEPASDFTDLGDVISQSVQNALKGTFDAFEGPGRERFEMGFEKGMEAFSENIARRAEEVARRVADQAERQAEQIARRTEEAARRATERVERASRRRSWQWPGQQPPPTPPAPPPGPVRRQPATEDERLAVLKMLSEGKITVEDATRLLEALGG